MRFFDAGKKREAKGEALSGCEEIAAFVAFLQVKKFRQESIKCSLDFFGSFLVKQKRTETVA